MRKTAAILAGVMLAIPLGAARASNDSFFDNQWGLKKVRAAGAWKATKGRGALIAVVDTGVDVHHPDLESRIVAHSDADFVDSSSNDGAQDEHGHGTHVAGIAAAVANNGIGVAGVAPRAKILPVRVLDSDGSGTTTAIAEGIRYAAKRGADVINLSLGVSGVGNVLAILGATQPIEDAIDFAWSKGAIVVAAAGNDAFPICGEPAGSERALCVGATTRNDELSSFSNSDVLASGNYLVAPGGDGESCAGDILSTVLRSRPRDECSPRRGYTAFAGTSMAAPFVSGAAALLAAEGLSNRQIVDCLLSTAADLGAEGRDSTFGHGRVDAAHAVGSCL